MNTKIKKPNYFQADRELASNMLTLINSKIDRGSLDLKYGHYIQELVNRNVGLEKCKGSILDDGTLDTQISANLIKIDELQEELSQKKDEVIKYDYTDADKNFLKVCKDYVKNGDKVALATGVCNFYRAYGFECPVDYAYLICDNITGLRAKSDKQIVKDTIVGKQFNLNKSNTAPGMLKVFLNIVATDCVLAGTIKVKDIAEDVRSIYEQELADKKAKKDQAKARREANKKAPQNLD